MVGYANKEKPRIPFSEPVTVFVIHLALHMLLECFFLKEYEKIILPPPPNPPPPLEKWKKNDEPFCQVFQIILIHVGSHTCQSPPPQTKEIVVVYLSKNSTKNRTACLSAGRWKVLGTVVNKMTNMSSYYIQNVR